MNRLSYGGLLFCGYATFQLLGFLIKAYPSTAGGAIALILLGLLLILVAGFNNWLGLYHRYHGVMSKNLTLVGFAPIYIFGGLVLFAVMVGLYAAS
jgi:hypothetical protein